MRTVALTRRSLGLISWLGVVGAIAILLPNRAVAQIVPDASLGNENSVVTPNTVIRGITSDRINGGAIRGSNLFHSFQQFNIGEGRGAYFANPAGIENILSRVTGNSRSEILGRLGVLGNANLFLLNPNGIVFGANASLDIAGSFTASTANAIALGDQGFFSATQPENSRLLAIAPGALYFDQQIRQPKTIQNSGTLTAGRDLTLLADNLELQGQLRSGGNLTLKAQDTVRIRDSATNPFIASAGGNLLVQGDRLVDIFALNHPNSGLFSGGNMVLRSANTVGGDAHYSTGGSFKLEQLNGGIGNLVSFYDPIIQADGNVTIGDYTGTSLHILAGGSVDLGNVVITGTDGLGTTINPTEYPLLANLTLSNGQPLTIDGSARPTLDVRAGINWRTLPGNQIIPARAPGFAPGDPVFAPGNGAANIVVRNIKANAPNSQIFLTNRFFRNPVLQQGNIFIESINVTVATGRAGDVIVDASGDITTDEIRSFVGANGTGEAGNISLFSASGGIDTTRGTLNASTATGSGGNITLQAAGNIRTANVSTFVGARGSGANGTGEAGNISLFSASGGIDTTRGTLNASTATGSGGNITLQAAGNIRTANVSTFVGARGIGFSGDITLISRAGSIDTRAGALSSSTQDGISGKIILDAFSDISTGDVRALSTGTRVGQAGDINITSANGTFFLSGRRVTSQASGVAEGGNIAISAKSVFLTNQAFITSSTFGQGNAGDRISVRANDTVSLSGGSQIRGIVESGGNGKASDIAIQARALRLTEGSQIQTALVRAITDATGDITPGGRGEGGKIDVIASDLVYIAGIGSNGFSSGLLSLSEQGASGPAGNLTVDVGTGNSNNSGAGLFRVESGGVVTAGTRNGGNGGDITINSRTFEALTGGEIRATSGDRNDPRGTTTGSAGTITVNAIDRVTISGKDPNAQDRISGLFVNTRDAGAGGSIAVTTAGSFSLSDGAIISSATSGQGGSANAGNIFISGGSISLQNKAQLQAQTSGVGDAGLVELQANGGAVSLDNSTIFSSVQRGAVGNAGGIRISGASISLKNSSQLQAQTGGTGNAGLVSLQALDGTVSLDNSTIFSSVQPGAVGNAGLVSLQALDGAVSLDKESFVFSRVESGAVGIAGGIELRAGSFSATNGSELTTSSFGRGDAGRIFVQTSGKVSLGGAGSGIFSAVGGNSTNKGGGIEILARNISLADRATINVNNGGLAGAAGNIEIATRNVELDKNSSITGETSSGNGGNIQIDAREYILLRRDSNISTSAGLRPSAGNGGKITITTPFIIAVPSRNSNILSQAFTGAGGVITINDLNGGTGLFGIARRSGDFPTSNDITTSSRFGASGITAITSLNTSVIENNLADLAQSFIDPNTLLANSCIVRNREKNSEPRGVFQITGSGGLPVRPGDPPPAAFPTGEVRSLPEPQTNRTWQPGDPIAEPQDIYRLANGKLVMSRECEL